MEEKFGAVLCGVALGQIPQSQFSKTLPRARSARISTMFYFKHMTPPRRLWCSPQQHRAIIDRLMPLRFSGGICEPAAVPGVDA